MENASDQASIVSDIVKSYSESYLEARDKFFRIVDDLGLSKVSYENPNLGREGEKLTTDVVLFGDSAPEKLIIVCSATHGVEGYLGSAVQTLWLQTYGKKPLPDKTAILFIHALNPYGFSWWRRTNEDNIDMNRNFIDFDQPLPVTSYSEIAEFIVPRCLTGEVRDQADTAMREFRKTQGEKKFVDAMILGQYESPEGLFYGGIEAAWSNETFRKILNRIPPTVKKAVWLDLHSGLGESGKANLFYPQTAEHKARVAEIFDLDIEQREKEKSSTDNYEPHGNIFYAVAEELADKDLTTVCIECGTVLLEDLILALREEASAIAYEGRESEAAQTASENLKHAFYVDTDEWKVSIWNEVEKVLALAIKNI